jgi:hypothetical protein
MIPTHLFRRQSNLHCRQNDRQHCENEHEWSNDDFCQITSVSPVGFAVKDLKSIKLAVQVQAAKPKFTVCVTRRDTIVGDAFKKPEEVHELLKIRCSDEVLLGSNVHV